MGNWLNTYQRMLSPTGKQITVMVDNGLFKSNPWTYINEAGIRYRNVNGKRTVEKSNNGAWDPINVNDEEYWDNYLNQVSNKLPLTPKRHYFGYLKDRITNAPVKAEGGQITNWLQTVPEEKCGGKVENAERGIKFKRNFARYGDTGDFNEFMFAGKTPFGKVVNEFMHPVQKDSISEEYTWNDYDPKDIGRYIQNQDTVYWEGKYTNDKNPFGVSPDQEASKKKFIDLLKYNTTGALYNDNDKNTLTRLRIENREQGGKLYNEDLIVAIEACGGKMKKKK